MKPIKFKEQNSTFAENQKTYLPLPAFRSNDEWSCVTSCWGLGLKERIKVLFTGRIWAVMPTWGAPVTPLKLTCDKKSAL